ncbi:O-antigen ligase family protein [Vibrio profundum]|uniref:O-antigen ligase family protein n=1 Tax=Vibrio profundum TaxID=2910247 RepID=UPI003D0BF430
MIRTVENMLSSGVIIGSLSTLLFAIYQYFILGEERVEGFLYSINFGYLACSLALLSFCMMKGGKYSGILFISFLASSVATVLTLTRGAIFAIPLLLILAIITRYKDFSIKKILLGIAMLVFATILSYEASTDIRDRINYTTQEITNVANGNIAEAQSTGGRLELWKAASYSFIKSPIIGMTYSERTKLNKKLAKQGKIIKWVTTVKRGHAHNQYFEMLASNGILGIVGFVSILFLPIYLFLSHYFRYGSLIGYTGGVFVAGFAIYGLTEVPLTANLIGAYYGFILATFLAIIRVEKYGNSLGIKTVNDQ